MDFSLLGLWSQMGAVARVVVLLLLGMSMFAIAISADRFLTFKKARERSLQFVQELAPLITGGVRLAEAAALKATYPDAPLARVVAAGVDEYVQSVRALGAAANDSIELALVIHGVGRSMERAKKREIAALTKGLPMLATISSSAPFVGLFGTVFGIITAFQQMADPAKGGGGGLATVSAGISEALLTTAVGLAVAIVAVWFYNFFTTRIEELTGLIDDASGEVADRLAQANRVTQTGQAWTGGAVSQ